MIASASTPCKGLSLRRIDVGVEGAPLVSIPVVSLHYSADPTMTAERVAKMRATSVATSGSDALWRREMEIEYEALEGERWFPTWSPATHDCEPFDLSDPNYWTIWHGADPHPRVPHAMTWTAFGASGDIVTFGELWPKERALVREYAETIKWLESDAEDKPANFCPGKKLYVIGRVLDTFGKAIKRVDDEDVDYFQKYRQYGINFRPAIKSHNALEAARERLLEAMRLEDVLREDGFVDKRPRYYTNTSCKELRWEFENVRYPEGDVLRDIDEKPETFRKHCVDTLLYVLTQKPKFIQRRKTGDTWEPLYPNTGY